MPARKLRILVFLPDPPDFDIRQESYSPDAAGGTRYRLPAIFELAAARYFDEPIEWELVEYIFHQPDTWPKGVELYTFDAVWVTGAGGLSSWTCSTALNLEAPISRVSSPFNVSSRYLLPDEGAYDQHVPYVPLLEAYIAENISHTRWLGISFGHQVIAWGLNPGGKNVFKSPTGWENAAVEATLTEQGRRSLKTVKKSYFVHNHHGDTVTRAPPGTVLVSSSVQTPCQALISDRVFTNEGHIEYSKGLMECWALWDSHFGLYSREAGLEFLEKRTYLDCDNTMNFLPDAVWLAAKMVGWMLGGLEGIPSDGEMVAALARNLVKAARVEKELEKKLCVDLYLQRVQEYGGPQRVTELARQLEAWRKDGTPLPHPKGTPSGNTNDCVRLLPQVNTIGLRNMKFDWPFMRIGTAEYPEGPTGTTVFHFPSGRATCAHDVRGGAPGSYMPGDGRVDAVCFAGGSVYGLEASAGVAAELFGDKGYSWRWFELQIVRGAIIYDFAVRQNAIYPDKELGRLAVKNAKPNWFPLGPRGAGCRATVGKLFGRGEQAGQGGAYRELPGGGKIACFTVVNAIGAIYDRNNKLVRGSLDPNQNRLWESEHGMTRLDLLEATEAALNKLSIAAQEKEKPPMGNTTITLVVTNLKVPQQALVQLAKQIHSSMARGIQPFHCPEDGDQLYMVSTNEVDPDPGLGMGVLGHVGGEVAWDAILSCYD